MTGRDEVGPKSKVRPKRVIHNTMSDEGRKKLQEWLTHNSTTPEQTRQYDEKMLNQLRRNNTIDPRASNTSADGMALGGFLGVVWGLVVGILIGVIVS